MTDPFSSASTTADDGAPALVARLVRHVGHQLRVVRETSGNVAGYVVEAVTLRCEDCSEPILEEAVMAKLAKPTIRKAHKIARKVARSGSAVNPYAVGTVVAKRQAAKRKAARGK